MSYVNGEPTARQWIVDVVTRTIDTSYEAQLAEIHEQARTAIVEGSGSGLTFDDYARARRSGDLGDYARAVGIYVVDVIREWVTFQIDEPRQNTPQEFLMVLLQELLDLGDSQQATMFGEHYLPEPEDLLEWAQFSYGGDVSAWLPKSDDDDEQ